MTFTDAKEVQVGEIVKGLLRADEIAVLRAVADRIVSNAHPEEDGRLDIAYAIARYLGLDWPAAQQPESRDVVDVYTMQTIAEAAAALDKRGDRQMAARLMRLHTRLLAALTEARNG